LQPIILAQPNLAVHGTGGGACCISGGQEAQASQQWLDFLQCPVGDDLFGCQRPRRGLVGLETAVGLGDKILVVAVAVHHAATAAVANANRQV